MIDCFECLLVGLTSRWNHGVIICSPATARLIMSRLGVNGKWIKVLDINNTVDLQGVYSIPDPDILDIVHDTMSATYEQVLSEYQSRRSQTYDGKLTITFLDANHCPGAVLVVFEIHGEKKVVHLHTGDMRYHPKMKSYNLLNQIPSQSLRIDKLYLDTTYAHPKHNFLSQEESIRVVLESVDEFIASLSVTERNRFIIFIGAYTIGKERIINAVADHLNECVYMDSEKLEIMRCIGDAYAKRIDSGQYTKDKLRARIHVCK